jgi:hypothetical protein
MRRRLVSTLSLQAVLIAVVGCLSWRQKEPVESPTAPQIIPVVSTVPEPSRSAAPVTIAEPAEPFVDLEMAEAPVRLILERLADIGGLRLIIPSSLNKTLSVQYIHVPVSVALNDVLKRSGLRLGAGPAANLPFDTVTVFYQLPANVDSMSTEAIMRRFGVSRAMAELIVKSRRP